MKKLIIIYATLIIALFSSCATIISGSRQTIKFTSYPSSASIYIDEINVGKTPIEAKLKRNQEHHIMIKMDGFMTYETNLTKKFNAWYIGNIVFGGIIGLIVDPITGAMYKLSPDEINAELAKGVSFQGDKTNIYIAVSLKPNPKWEKIGQLTRI